VEQRLGEYITVNYTLETMKGFVKMKSHTANEIFKEQSDMDFPK
jgi:hypothetical protein